MNAKLVKDILSNLRQFASNQALISAPIHVAYVVSMRDSVASIADDIAQDNPLLAQKLKNVKTQLFFATQAGQTFINPIVLGEAIFCLEYLEASSQCTKDDIWSLIHPLIQNSSRELYEDGHFANAAEDAFIEINDRVKKLYKKINPTASRIPDGDAAMTTVFSVNCPMLKVCDISTDTGMNEQKGLMLMLQGAMSALRNPKAHSNISLSKYDAMRRIMYASMLMYKIDEAVEYSRIKE